MVGGERDEEGLPSFFFGSAVVTRASPNREAKRDASAPDVISHVSTPA